ncbi:MAG: YciI family protein [Bacteroidota bacterium]|nr:YciI family protein [Bacteroidota bacterium]MDP4229203.1 YciI family protein [Bacteroidota bacterium]MDP4235257.1 YciI family protein [Bacteroidota bacterium]
MKYYIINLQYTKPMTEVQETTPEHRAYLKTKYDEGILLFSGPRVPRTAGVLFGRAENLSVIEEMIAADPFKKKGIAEYEIIEIAPAMWAEDLNNIFKVA